ncbi:hypothetical protein TGME49_307050 [Toxoplasma gondii ME49]|uniref:Uncharacterized protein n=2 Tax=Toxoplasma gondii TaxID=5811 RepID=A0A125YG88_TOXGV|nr:hypothetical protein TGME49_307050 [Toxoplasma gondii ME49]EPT26364.1 hypothetical protein TGME49_307050 [Toxoplasma gondii ME49]ESS28263.1 hypothetical protein TGVEG_307050 [Toxoplasma gondii VEG]|eukprot:XP_018635661.1 hypothetical protein TGME49_307050 [Toxoplasma gondii ME49]
MLPITVTTPRSPNCISRTEHSRVEHAGRMGGISTACRLMVSGWRVAAASRLRCGGEGADFHAEDGVERS